MDTKSKVFVIMPFSDDFFESYEMLKDHFEDRFEFSHAGDEDNQQNILADIIPPIYNADIVLADLTGLNPNVMYELGIAHSFNKKTIIITRDDIGTLPFDLKQYRVKDYSTHFKKFDELIKYLEKNLSGAVDGSVIFSNPVSDFLENNKMNPTELFAKETIKIDIYDGEKGFLDFLADIEEDAATMIENVYGMNDEMASMRSGMEQCTEEINRVNSNGGSGNASFVRKQAQKVAGYITTFSKQLKNRTNANSTLWAKIEKNTLGLLENKYASQDENRGALVGYLKSLKGMQDAIFTSNDSISTIKETSLKNQGLERHLTQAIKFLDEDLAGYLVMTGQICGSIDRIIDKSKFVVGDISFTQEDSVNANT